MNYHTYEKNGQTKQNISYKPVVNDSKRDHKQRTRILRKRT